MNLGVFAFGNTGCKILAELSRFERRTHTSLSAFTIALDTDHRHLQQFTDYADETVPYGHTTFHGAGTSADLENAVTATKNIRDTLAQYAQYCPPHEINGFLLLGSLGGGTGGGGVSVLAQYLANAYPDMPVYATGVLPSPREPDILTLTAAQSLQSWDANTDIIFLADNKHLGVAFPEYAPVNTTDTTQTEMFGEVNQRIARNLHFLLTADNITPPNNQRGLTTTDFIRLAQPGGIVPLSLTTQPVPPTAQPPVRGLIAQIKHELTRLVTGSSHSPQKHHPSDTQTESPPAPTTNTDDTQAQPSTRPEQLTPSVFDPAHTLVQSPTAQARNSLFLLIGPNHILQQVDTTTVTNWARQNTASNEILTRTYPVNRQQIGVLHAGINVGTPQRITSMYTAAEQIAAKLLTERAYSERAKQNTPTVTDNSIPPVL